MAFEIDEAAFAKIRPRVDNDSAALGILFVRSPPDADLLDAARDHASSGFRQVFAFLGKDTNLDWITSQCAETAYARGLIDETEVDRLMDC